MLQGDTPVSNADPFATEATGPEDWVTDLGPHLMMVVPNRDVLADISTDHLNGGPWVMWPDTQLSRHLSDALVSPDGKWLAFRRNTEIWVAVLGTEPRLAWSTRSGLCSVEHRECSHTLPLLVRGEELQLIPTIWYWREDPCTIQARGRSRHRCPAAGRGLAG